MHREDVGYSGPQMGLKQGPERASMDMCGGTRENAKSVLERRVRMISEERTVEEVLLKVIPWELLSKQDEEVIYNWFNVAFHK